VLDRHLEVHEPELPRLLRDLGWKELLLVVLGGDGNDLFGREATGGRP
jgi:hypothetical protein